MRGSALQRAVIVSLTVAVVAIVGLVLVQQGFVVPRPDRASPVRSGFDPPVALPADGQYVRSRVLPSGDLEVEHWIRSSAPVYRIDLAVPSGIRHRATVLARDVRVESEGARSAGPRTVGEHAQAYFLSGASTLHVSYRLSGVLVRSRSVPGRALVRTTSLELDRTPDHGSTTVVVVGAKVLGATCAPGDGARPPRPCGKAVRRSWRVDLGVRRAHDRVLVQLDLT